MRIRRRVEVTSVTREVVALKRREAPADAACHECAAGGPMLAPERAAQLAGISAREVYRRVEAGRVHFRESPGGSLLVCLASLPPAF